MDVQTFPCFSMLSLTKPSTDLRRADGPKLICHLWETSAEHTHTKKAAAGVAFPLCNSRDGAFSRLRPCTVSLCFFTIMILSCVHKHTSPKCFPSRAGNRSRPCLICNSSRLYSPFLCPAAAWKFLRGKHMKSQLNHFESAVNSSET